MEKKENGNGKNESEFWCVYNNTSSCLWQRNGYMSKGREITTKFLSHKPDEELLYTHENSLSFFPFPFFFSTFTKIEWLSQKLNESPYRRAFIDKIIELRFIELKLL